jgi:hypothetical protein
MKPLKTTLFLISVLMVLASCAQPPTREPGATAPTAAPTSAPSSPAVQPQSTRTDTTPPTSSPNPTQKPLKATRTITPQPSATPLPERNAADWQDWPVIPEGVSVSMIELYQQGLDAGNAPKRFSKIGDCQNISTYFLATFDKPDRYDLGEYTVLQDTIDWYAGSFKRDSAAVRGGLNVAAVQNALFTKSKDCKKGENPLACEIRANNPSVVLVSYEELWDGNTQKYTRYYESMIQYLLDHKVVPILGTTANNQAANRIVADLAVKYDLPVWNLWAALQPLRNHGIVDGFHLTQWDNIFNFASSARTYSGWHVRNLTALQALDAVHRVLEAQPAHP